MRGKSESNKLAKEYIVTALIELMKVQDYHDITITDLTKKAGVSRMAYYRNYTSKEDIINKFIDDVGTSIHEKLESLRSHADVYAYYYELFMQLGSYNDLAITAYHAGLGELILAQITKNMALTFPGEGMSATERYRHLHIAGAFYNIFINWLKNGQKESVADMAKLCCSLTCEGCHITFEKGAKQ